MSGTPQPGPTSPPYPTSPYPPRPPVKHGPGRAMLAGAVAVVVVIAAVVVALLVLHSAGVTSPPPPTYWDNVTGVNWYQSGAGTSTIYASGPGFSVMAGHPETLVLDVQYNGCFLFCGNTETVSAPTIGTPGWALLSANTPLAVPSGTTGYVTLVVEGTSGQSYTGVLSITITLTS